MTPKSSSTHTLSEQINVATRPIHSELNRLIIARLPFALPPHASNPHTYLTGLVRVASIYAAFEQLWQELLDAPLLPTTLSKPPSFDACDPEHSEIDYSKHRPKLCTRTHSVLQYLHLPGLLRNDRIRADIRYLSGLQDPDVDDLLQSVSQESPLADFLAHIHLSVETNPHVLLAYAWVLYMALFSGGRFLRLSLYAVGPDFWAQSSVTEPFADRPNLFFGGKAVSETKILTNHGRKVSSSDNLYIPSVSSHLRKFSRSHDSSHSPSSPSVGLQFLNFIGEEDGEDIKLEFKRRIVEAEILLTPGEKDDIVQEAQDIFEFMVALVHVLHDACEDPIDESGSSDESIGLDEETQFPASDEDTSTDPRSSLLDIHKSHLHSVTVSRHRGMPRDSVSINHDRLQKRHRSDTQKDWIPPGTLLTGSTTIHFKGQEQDRKGSLATVLEPVKKIVHWGAVETMCGKISHRAEGLGRDVRRMSTVPWKERGVIGSEFLMPALVILLAIMAWSLLWLFGYLEHVE